MASQVSAIARNELPATVSFSRGLKFTEGPSKFSPTFLDSILVNSTTANRLEAFSEAQSQALPSNFGSKDSQYYQSDQSDLLLHPVADDLNAQPRIETNAQLRVNDAATMIQKHARAMITKCNFFDMLLHLFGFKKDTCITTCEAEIAALVSALKEAMFVLEILFDLGHEFDSVDGYTDSKSGYDTVMNPGVTKRTAHFERWLFWARELYLEKRLLLNHIRDEDMMADSLSKVTDRAKFLKCRAAQLNLNHG